MEIQKKGNKYELLLNSKSLKSIIRNHTKLFPNTPGLNDFISHKVLLKKGKSYLLNLWACDPDYWPALSSEIGALLWHHLKGNKSSTKSQIFSTWFLKMNFINEFELFTEENE